MIKSLRFRSLDLRVPGPWVLGDSEGLSKQVNSGKESGATILFRVEAAKITGRTMVHMWLIGLVGILTKSC